jgi:hypothetical protein
MYLANRETILDTAYALHYLTPRLLRRRTQVKSPDEAFQTMGSQASPLLCKSFDFHG